MTLAKRLKSLRDHTDLSCRELAYLIRSSPAYPSLIESGKRPHIGTDLAGELARVFGTTIDYLVAGTGRAPSEKTVLSAVAKARALADRQSKTPLSDREAPTRKAV